MAPILTIFGPNRSRRRDLFFENFSNERRRHRSIVVVVIVAVVAVVGGFWVACIKGTSLKPHVVLESSRGLNSPVRRSFAALADAHAVLKTVLVL